MLLRVCDKLPMDPDFQPNHNKPSIRSLHVPQASMRIAIVVTLGDADNHDAVGPKVEHMSGQERMASKDGMAASDCGKRAK